MVERFVLLVVPEKSGQRSDPQIPGLVTVQRSNPVAAQGGTDFRVVAEHLEGIAVEAVQAVACADPDKSVVVLDAGSNHIIAQAMFHLIMTEDIIRLLGRPCKQRKKTR